MEAFLDSKIVKMKYKIQAGVKMQMAEKKGAGSAAFSDVAAAAGVLIATLFRFAALVPTSHSKNWFGTVLVWLYVTMALLGSFIAIIASVVSPDRKLSMVGVRTSCVFFVAYVVSALTFSTEITTLAKIVCGFVTCFVAVLIQNYYYFTAAKS